MAKRRSRSPEPALAKGRYVVTALVKSLNAHGPGGRMEIEVTQGKAMTKLATVRHFVGHGAFDWQRQGFPSRCLKTALPSRSPLAMRARA